jgi:hypothetical protein
MADGSSVFSIPGYGLKTGLLTLVLKKEKDPKIPGNYRGIAVTPVLGKILESIIKDHIESTLIKVFVASVLQSMRHHLYCSGRVS